MPRHSQWLVGKFVWSFRFRPAGRPISWHGRLHRCLGDALKATVVIDNRGGAGGSLGADAVAKSAPDGRTLLMATVGTHAINPALYKKSAYDAVRDFTPIALVAMAPVAIVVHPAQPVSTVAELVALAKRMPGKLNYGSARCRHARSPHRRNVQERGGHRPPARAVQGQRARGHRPGRRTAPDHVRSAAIGAVERARAASCAPSRSAARSVRRHCRTSRRSPSPATAASRPRRGGACLLRLSCLPTWLRSLASDIERIVAWRDLPRQTRTAGRASRLS